MKIQACGNGRQSNVFFFRGWSNLHVRVFGIFVKWMIRKLVADANESAENSR